MESSALIKQEYFELVKKLNAPNVRANQVTNVHFYIDSLNSDPSLEIFIAVKKNDFKFRQGFIIKKNVIDIPRPNQILKNLDVF